MDNFEDVLNQHKEKARKVYAESGEGNLLRSALREIESNCADYEYYFQMGQQSKQKRIDELQARLGAALFDMNQRKLELCESCDGYKDPVGVCQSEGLEMAINILEQALKGGEV